MSESKKTLWQVLKFTLFSASAGLIQVASFTLFNEVFHWSYWAAYLPSLVLSVLWNFTFNRRYTFRSNANIPRAMALVSLLLRGVHAPEYPWRQRADRCGLERVSGASADDAAQFCDGVSVSAAGGVSQADRYE